MRLINLLRALALSLSLLSVLALTGCPSVNHIHKAMHTIHWDSDDDNDWCTAYAVGRHTVATAAHCYTPDKSYFIDDTAIKIEKLMNDGADHILIVESGITFDNYIPFRLASPKQGDKVYTFGNPINMGLTDQYREGYYTGTLQTPGRPDVRIFIIPMIGGDSGALILNDHGYIVGQVAMGRDSWTFSLGFKFTKEQLKAIE